MPGGPGEYTAGTPQDVKALRAKMIAQIMSGAERGATPYGGPIGTSADPAQLQAMNMLMGLSQKGAMYKRPGMYSMPGQPTMAGGLPRAGAGAGAGPGSNTNISLNPNASAYPNSSPSPNPIPGGPGINADSSPAIQVGPPGPGSPNSSIEGDARAGRLDSGADPAHIPDAHPGVDTRGLSKGFDPKAMFQLMSALRGMGGGRMR